MYKKFLPNFWFQKSDSKLISSFGYSTFVKNREEVYEILVKNNIESRPVICGNIAKQPFMKGKYLNSKDNFSNANFVDKFGIYLPNHANLSIQDIDLVTKKFLKIAKPIFSKKIMFNPKKENHKTAVILCGGKGSRLGPLSKKIPKSLVLVKNKPIIWYILKNLKKMDLIILFYQLDIKVD